MTPTTVRPMPPMRMVRPTIPGSAWKASRHSPSERIVACAPPVWPSASVNVRPSNACAPSIEKRFGVTRGASTLCEAS